MNTEALVINHFAVKSRYIGDDAAVVGSNLYSQDAFFENVHFKRSWISLYQIGFKAMIINLSDAIAMNADPRFALVTLALPKTLHASGIAELIAGIQDAGKKYGCEVIGGDTIANIKIDISITIISQTNKPLRRNHFRNGDILAFTGDLGRSKRDLRKLISGQKLSKNSRFVRPVLRQNFITKSARLLNAGMDISDGLFEDARKMTSAKNLSFTPFIYVSKEQGCSGEEYEMLVSFSPRVRKALYRRAQQTRTPLTPFATIKRGKKNRFCKANHF